MSLNQNPGIGLQVARGTTSSTQKDHQPGPGQYSIPGSFEQTEREKLQNELLSTRYKGSSPKQPSASSGSGSETPNQQAPTSSSPFMSGSKRTREDDAAGSLHLHQNDITKQKISNE